MWQAQNRFNQSIRTQLIECTIRGGPLGQIPEFEMRSVINLAADVHV